MHRLRREPDGSVPQGRVVRGQSDAALGLRPTRRGVGHFQYDKLLDTVADTLPKVHDHLDSSRGDILAFTVFPREVWRQIWSNNANERLNR
jgi:Transposase, Mutator family